MKNNFTLSITSHGHRDHIRELLLDLAVLKREDFNVILTLNLPEELPLDLSTLPFEIIVIHNDIPKGFGENHNAAFTRCESEFFVILNPDVRLLEDPFDVIMGYLRRSPYTICAPLVVDEKGQLENSARFFPTPLYLTKKLIYKLLNIELNTDQIPESELAYFPDWVAGMFVVVASKAFEKINGFDESYHMYYEDVDFCMRAKVAGYNAVVLKDAKVIHEAQRDSHRKIRHLIWHLQSALRFFASKQFVQYKISQWLDAFRQRKSDQHE
jgi:N-acetylglucosaminyl-diphospho-decaprenol L-rhamnosyltransferase